MVAWEKGSRQQKELASSKRPLEFYIRLQKDSQNGGTHQVKGTLNPTISIKAFWP